MDTTQIAAIQTKPLQKTLERAGWYLISVEIDMTAETARIELRRGELRITFDARNGRAMMERHADRMVVETSHSYTGGRRNRAEILRSEFLGRTRYPGGVRSGLALFCNYLADNAIFATPRLDIRNAARLLMG